MIDGMGQYGLAKSLGIGSLSAKTFIARYFARTLALPNTCSAPKNKPQSKASSRTRPAAASTCPTSATKTPPPAPEPNAPPSTPHARHCIRPHQTRHDRRIPLAFRRPEKQIDYAVHDELVLEAPEVKLDLVKEKLSQMMAKVNEGILKVPLIAEVGLGMNWGKAY
nr:DNA polymerase [uncultured Ottowia sp.]